MAFGKDGDKALFDGLQKYIQAGQISTDALLWVWATFSQDQEKLDVVFTNPTVVFRALNYGESGGAALKSKKELKKLLMKDDKFIDYMSTWKGFVEEA